MRTQAELWKGLSLFAPKCTRSFIVPAWVLSSLLFSNVNPLNFTHESRLSDSHGAILETPGIPSLSRCTKESRR